MKSQVTLSVLVPAYNESKTIKKLLGIVKKVDLKSKGIKKEIIVIDDGSKDNTVNIVNKIEGVKLIRHKKNKGKGAAIRTGIKNATGNIIIIQDADLEYDPNDYYKLIKPIIDGKTKVVYGSRILYSKQKELNKQFLKGKHTQAYSVFYLGGRILTLLSNVLYNAKITDEATCYKVFDANVIKSIPFKGNKFEWEPEITAKLCKRGYKIMELPTPYHPRSFEQGKKIKFRDGIQAVWTLIKYKFVN
jgi:glycosyltransferase involved in cell wall biosynthesis